MATKNRAKTLKSSIARYTFTLSATPDFSDLMGYFDERLKGLNRGEVVKLALIELKQSLTSKDANTQNTVWLTDEQEKELAISLASADSEPMNAKEMISWLEN
jgi:hypothetical protein